MSCVYSMLTNEEAILPQPKQPGFFIERNPSNSGAILRNEESNIENAVTITCWKLDRKFISSLLEKLYVKVF